MSFEYFCANALNITLAGVFFFIHFLLWFHSVQRTTIANSVIIFNLSPVFVAIGAKFFHKEKLTTPLLHAIFLGLLGILIIEWNAFSIDTIGVLGDFLALASAMCFSMYLLLAKRLRQNGLNLSLTFYFNAICVVGFAVASFGRGLSFFDYPTSSWLTFLALAIVPSLLGHTLYTYSLKYIRATVASCSKLLEPVLAAISAAWVFNEAVPPNTIIGFLLILVGLLKLYFGEKQRAENGSI